ncbi:NAD(P)/FAD-dependent oxidoreductase [Bdellovibrionota bacterium FG-2]
MQPQKSIAIIGAGLAGLSAGVFAQKAGFKVTLFEHHSKPGGVCTSWRRGENSSSYIIDGCIHWLMGSKPDSPLFSLYKEVGALDGIQLETIKHFGHFAWGDGRHFDVTSDLLRLEADLRRQFPEDGLIVDELIAAIRAFQNNKTDWSVLSESGNWIAKTKAFWGMRKQLRYYSRYRLSAQEYSTRITDPFFAWIIQNIFMPEIPMFFAFMILGQLADGELTFPREGSLAFSRGIEKKFKELGGEIRYNSSVEEILVENSQAIGVRLFGGAEVRSDIIISAADIHSTLYKLLGGQFVNYKWKDRFQKWPLFTPLCLVSFGVNRPFIDEASSQLIRQTTAIASGGHAEQNLFIKIFKNTTLAPSGKTVLQVMLPTQFDYWNKLLTEDPERYLAEKSRITEEVLAALETRYPGLRSDIEVSDVATPTTFVRYTRNHKGAWEGWMISPASFAKRVQKKLPGLKNFYLTGQWVEPGGGVPTVLMSGRSVVRQILRDKI